MLLELKNLALSDSEERLNASLRKYLLKFKSNEEENAFFPVQNNKHLLRANEPPKKASTLFFTIVAVEHFNRITIEMNGKKMRSIFEIYFSIQRQISIFTHKEIYVQQNWL